MKRLLIVVVLLLAGCSDGPGRYAAIGIGPPPVILDTKTGCILRVERNEWVQESPNGKGKTIYSFTLVPVTKERCKT